MFINVYTAIMKTRPTWAGAQSAWARLRWGSDRMGPANVLLRPGRRALCVLVLCLVAGVGTHAGDRRQRQDHGQSAKTSSASEQAINAFPVPDAITAKIIDACLDTLKTHKPEDWEAPLRVKKRLVNTGLAVVRDVHALMLDKKTDSVTKQHCADVLVAFQGKVVRLFIEDLGNPDRNNRLIMVECLGRINGKEAITAIEKTVRDDLDSVVRARAAFALSEYGNVTDATMQALIAGLDDPDDFVQAMSHKSLKALTREDLPKRSSAWLNWWKHRASPDS